MQTFEATLTDDAWTEVLGDESSIWIDIKGGSDLALTLTHSDVAPAIDAPFVRVQSFSPGYDYTASGLPSAGQYIWDRALLGLADIVVVK